METFLASPHTLKCLAVRLSNERKIQTQPCLQVESPAEDTPGAEYEPGHEI